MCIRSANMLAFHFHDGRVRALIDVRRRMPPEGIGRSTRGTRRTQEVQATSCASCVLYLCYLTANTQTAPPCGTSGNSPGRPRFSTPCMPTGSTPQPDCTAIYCLPSIEKDVGWLVMPEL